MIGTNRSDATATMRAIIADAETLRPGRCGRAARSRRRWRVVRGRSISPGWDAIDAAEVARGAGRGSPRIKLARWEELLAAAEPGDREADAPQPPAPAGA